MLVFIALKTMLLITVFFILCVLSGTFILQTSGRLQKYSFSLRLAVSWCLGITVHLSSYLLLGQFIPAATASLWSIVFTFIIACMAVLFNHSMIYKWCRQPYVNRKKLFTEIIPVILLIVIVGVLWAMVWLQLQIPAPPQPLETNPFANVGSLHSVRYVTIAQYIVNQNTLPVINQGFGQSLFISEFMFIGVHNPYFALSVYLLAACLVFSLMIYGILRQFQCNPWIAHLGVLIILLSSTALSLTPVTVIDSYSPFLRNGYPDNFLAIMNAIIIVVLLIELQIDSKNLKLRQLPSIVIICSTIGFLWNVIGAQNGIIIGITLFIYAIIMLLRKSNAFLPTFCLLVLIGGSLYYGRLAGGLLAPKLSVITDESYGHISGVQHLIDDQFLLRFYLPYAYQKTPTWLRDFDTVESVPEISLVDPQSQNYSLIATWHNFIQAIRQRYFFWLVEQQLWNALHVAFWALIGWIVCASMIRKKIFTTTQLHWFGLTGLISLISLGITFSIKTNNYGWEMNRFAMLGYVFGLICTVMVLDKMLYQKQWMVKIFFWFTASTIMPLSMVYEFWYTRFDLVNLSNLFYILAR